MEQKKEDQTQLVDLGLAAPHAPQLRVTPAVGQQAGVSFDLAGSGQQAAAAPSLSVANSGFNTAGNPGSSFGDTSQNMPTIGFQNVFTQDVKMVKQQKLSPVMQVLAALTLVIFMLVGAAWYVTGDIVHVLVNPHELLNIFALDQEDSDGLTPDPTPIAKADTVTNVPPPDSNKALMSSAPVSSPDPKQEYSVWSQVKNELGGELPQRGARLSADQEATLTAGLTHEFNYQRYKTVLDLAATNAPGSEELLRQALESKKFWTRMRALIALADMGDQVTDDDVREALGDAHSELRARFFKRFEKSPCSVGCFFVARAALKHLDAHGRKQALRVVSREASDIRDVYMIAATFDGHEVVRQTAQNWLATRQIDPAVWQDVKNRYGLAH